jgi:hypothetical protein
MPIYFRAILIDPDSSLVTVGLCGSLAEEKQKRRYEAVFVAKLNDCVRSGFCPSGREACRRQFENILKDSDPRLRKSCRGSFLQRV